MAKGPAEREELIAKGYECVGNEGRYEYWHPPGEDRDEGLRNPMVPTEDVFAERDGYLGHLSSLSFKYFTERFGAKLFSREYPNGTVYVGITDVDGSATNNRGYVEIELSTSQVPEERARHTPLLLGIFGSNGYTFLKTGLGKRLERGERLKRIGVDPLEDLKEDISFVDTVMTRFPDIAGSVASMLE